MSVLTILYVLMILEISLLQQVCDDSEIDCLLNMRGDGTYVLYVIYYIHV